MKYFCKNCLLFAVASSRYETYFKFDQSVFAIFMIVRHILEISEDDHPGLMNGEP